MFFVGAMVMLSDLCTAGMVTLLIPVPKDPFPKRNPGGWGALVLTLDMPATTTSFIFTPKCNTAKPGVADPTSNSKTWQLGPGGYGLLPTNSPVEGMPGTLYGPFRITITYPDDKQPKITSAFWQSKPTPGGERTWTFNGKQDLMAKPSQFFVLPEPSALSLSLSAGCMLLALARWRRARE
jgi:hypothetical protein